jgi:hypothetical protein
VSTLQQQQQQQQQQQRTRNNNNNNNMHIHEQLANNNNNNQTKQKRTFERFGGRRKTANTGSYNEKQAWSNILSTKNRPHASTCSIIYIHINIKILLHTQLYICYIAQTTHTTHTKAE